MSIEAHKGINMTEILRKPSREGRAWVEIDLEALARNFARLSSLTPDGCELMAVVKSDAYGHGAAPIAARLFQEGARSFAVATVDEGMLLRDCGIEGEILVLGYTHPENARFLGEYGLTQLIFDDAHAKALDDTNTKIRVHISIDTGMHREGISASDISGIESVFNCKNLTVDGMGTHLASSDSRAQDDAAFTRTQIDKFYEMTDVIKNKGYDAGKLHIQATYGMLNYPDIRCDYVRAGIGLFGVMSHSEPTLVFPELDPVLSLKAVVAQTRRIDEGESVSYGRIFTADKPMMIATVCIGYADGVPRHISGNGGAVLIRGRRAPIVGRVCMDLLMADVTGIDDATQGDIATLIGRDGDEEICCEELAGAAGTITNEILCRLGSRLPRKYMS